MFSGFAHKNANELFCKMGDAAENNLSNAFLKFLENLKTESSACTHF